MIFISPVRYYVGTILLPIRLKGNYRKGETMTNLIKSSILAFTLLVSLAACAEVATPAGPEQPTNTPPAEKAAPSQTPPVEAPVPTKNYAIVDSNLAQYPAPGEPVVEGPLAALIEGSSLGMSQGVLPRPVLRVSGDLPTPCHELAYKVRPPDKDNQVFVSLAVVPPAKGINCIQVISPINKEIPLGDLASGTYTVFVNGVKVGTLTV
jgi:predicted small lipoprotein YifL